jgi:hypothetical protein
MQDKPRTASRSKLPWWTATLFQLVGVFALASRQADPQLCYAVMLVGSVSGIFAAGIDRNRALLLLNSGYTLSNIIGIIQW